MRVLLVEDDTDTRHVLSKLLTLWGHEVAEAETVAAAISLLGDFRFEAVVTDVGLPDGTGIQVIEEATRSVPPMIRVALTAHGTANDRHLAVRAGANHYMTKPFDSACLKAVLSCT
jgi:DNA-binding response OmpR family regulator